LSTTSSSTTSLPAASTLRTLLLAALLLGVLPARAQDPAVSEQALKAVLFYRLPLFVYRTTTEKDARVGICTLGYTPLDSAIDKLPDTLIDGRGVDFRAIPGPAEADECDFLFIGRSEAGRLDHHLRRLNGRRLVTVSDLDGFARAGGMVEFALRPDGSGIQLLINRRAAQKQSIEFSARLLRLAKIVEP
jgi:hypothetical protein